MGKGGKEADEDDEVYFLAERRRANKNQHTGEARDERPGVGRESLVFEMGGQPSWGGEKIVALTMRRPHLYIQF